MEKTLISLVPIIAMAIVFSLMNWQEIASVGMILFWAILIIAIYNIIILLVKLFDNSNDKPKKIKAKKEKGSKDTKSENK